MVREYIIIHGIFLGEYEWSSYMVAICDPWMY